jgi:hypothetical protein
MAESAGGFIVGNGNTNGTPTTGLVQQNGGTVRVGVDGDADLTIGLNGGANGTYNLAGGVLDLTGGDIVFGAGPSKTFSFTGGRLQDVASTNFNLEQQGGTLAPGVPGTAGFTTIGGDYSLGATGRLELEVFAEPVSDFLIVSGLVTLSGHLDILAPPGLPVGQRYVILQNQGLGSVFGEFLGKPDESVFGVQNNFFRIDYQGGDDGNDIQLLVIPEPASSALLLGLLGFAGTVRFRKQIRNSSSAGPPHDGQEGQSRTA